MNDTFDDFNKKKPNTVEKQISHPCEEVFDIEDGSTLLSVQEPRSTDLVASNTYDNKDTEIEEQYQEVYNKAMDAFDDIQNDMEGIEGKFKARNNEVGVQFLNAALSAAKEKSRMKEHKDKLNPGITGGSVDGVVNNTQINVSTSDVIKMLAERRDPANNYVPDEDDDAIEATIIEEEPRTQQRTTIKRKKKEDLS